MLDVSGIVPVSLRTVGRCLDGIGLWEIVDLSVRLDDLRETNKTVHVPTARTGSCVEATRHVRTPSSVEMGKSDGVG